MKAKRISAFEPHRARQIKSFGKFTTAARVRPATEDAVMELMANLPINATPSQIAARLDEIERSHTHYFLKPSEHDEVLHREALQVKGKTVLGISKLTLQRFSASERLVLVNSGGKALPSWYIIERQNEQQEQNNDE